jgi:hypothetical protein
MSMMMMAMESEETLVRVKEVTAMKERMIMMVKKTEKKAI